MIPDIQKITIWNNEERIISFIKDVIIGPKHTLLKWSEITRQTPSFKLGYIGQHLASLITGVQGSGSGARGDDLLDKTEVKSCNKIDQLDRCNACGGRVLRYEKMCSSCGSDNIDRKDDSKWLFSIRSEKELNQYISLDRVFLLIMDYPYFDVGNFKDIRISAFEIYPKENRCKIFNKLITNHYYNIYVPKVQRNNKANPMNLHPYHYQFYKCNPTLIFNCIVSNINDITKTTITILHYIKPNEERVHTIPMPTVLLKDNEWLQINYDKIQEEYKLKMNRNEFLRLSKHDKCILVTYLNESQREDLQLRDIISTEQHTEYNR